MTIPLSSSVPAETSGQIRSNLRIARTLTVSLFEWLGELSIFCGRLARAAVTRPFEGRELMRQMDAVGTRSALIVALAGAATGVVLSLQTRDSLSRFGARSLLPAALYDSLSVEENVAFPLRRHATKPDAERRDRARGANPVLDLQNKRQVTSVVVTHDLHNAAAFADRLVMLREGSIVMEGTQAQLRNSRDPFVRQFLDAAA